MKYIKNFIWKFWLNFLWIRHVMSLNGYRNRLIFLFLPLNEHWYLYWTHLGVLYAIQICIIFGNNFSPSLPRKPIAKSNYGNLFLNCLLIVCVCVTCLPNCFRNGFQVANRSELNWIESNRQRIYLSLIVEFNTITTTTTLLSLITLLLYVFTTYVLADINV